MDPGRFDKVGKTLLFTLCLYMLFLLQVSSSTADEASWEGKLADGSFHLSVRDGLLSLHAQRADLIKILQEISEKSNIKIEIHPSVTGSVTASLRDLPIDEVLKRITDNLALVSVKEKGQKSDRILKAVIVASSQIKHQTELQTPPQPSPMPPTRNSDKKKKGAQHYPNQELSPAKTTKKHKTDTRPNVVPSEMIIKFKKGLANEDILALIAGTGATIKTHIQALNYYVLALPAHLSVDEALAWYRQQDVVDHSEPNYLIPIKDLPNDPDFSQQWALHNIGQTGGATDADIDAVEAWNLDQGGVEVVIAVIDTGVDYTHEDLNANIWQNSDEIPGNGINDDNNGYIADTIGGLDKLYPYLYNPIEN